MAPFLPNTIPAATDVEHIVQESDPVLRNLLITQCYAQLSKAFLALTGEGANWCTFATWASRQAGKTIRKEDLRDALEARLHISPGMETLLKIILRNAKENGQLITIEQLWQSAKEKLLVKAIDRSSDAVSRGNKKVFEEIGYAFACFIKSCGNDTAFDKDHIDQFCSTLKQGDPPDGQIYLQKAFTRYYHSFLENDSKHKSELQLLANIEIGFHEQTRLQPEIAEALDSALPGIKDVKKQLLKKLYTDDSFWVKLKNFFLQLFGKENLVSTSLQYFLQQCSWQIHHAMTRHLMSLTLPPDRRLLLGSDIIASFPEHLKILADADLLALLKVIDPTPDNLDSTGATDWSNLQERLHYIADLFRCYHYDPHLFDAPFSVLQTSVLKGGQLPSGQL